MSDVIPFAVSFELNLKGRVVRRRNGDEEETRAEDRNKKKRKKLNVKAKGRRKELEPNSSISAATTTWP